MLESSIENLLVNFTTNNEVSKTQDWSIKDFNNVETADRKLIVNKKFEFWVHDDALCYNSDYFSDIIKPVLKDSSKVDTSISGLEDEGSYKKTDITIPHEELFLDVLLWIYTRDSRKLQKAAKSFESFLYLISIGVYLRMKQDFFEILFVSKANFEWKLEYFKHGIWSRPIFNFGILERIVSDMKANNYTKVIALVSWLKDYDIYQSGQLHQSSITKRMSKEFSFLCSYDSKSEEVNAAIDLYLVRNYIIRHKLMSGLTHKEVTELFYMFPHLHSSFDTETLINEFVFASKKNLNCLVCKKTFQSALEVIESPECLNGSNEQGYYHPRIRTEKNFCLHEGCNRKITKTELGCCHKPAGAPGCLAGEGRHILVIED